MSIPSAKVQSNVNSPLASFFDTDTESNFSFPFEFATVQDTRSVSTAADDPELREVLSTLLDLEAVNPSAKFQKDKEKIESAIHLNEEMQRFAERQIQRIDLMLRENVSLMHEANQLAIAEKRACQPFLIHETYKKEADYFEDGELLSLPSATMDTNTSLSMDNNSSPAMDDSTANYIERMEGISETTTEASDDNDSVEEMLESANEAEKEENKVSKLWTTKERRLLEEGVLTEAKRNLCMEFVKKNEPWRYWEVEKKGRYELTSFDVSHLDWQRISSKHVLSKTATECLIQWTTQEHPSINKKPWSKQESQRLTEIVEEIGLYSGQWELIASRLGTNRTIAQCFSHYMFEKNNAQSKKKWTPKEDALLARAVKIFGNHNWQMIASLLKGRTGQQCLHRWQKAIHPSLIKKKKWTAEEDKNLKRAVQLYGIGQWKNVQRLVPGRTDAQCRERYMNVLDPSLKKEPFSDEESKRLMELVNEHGRKWSYLARLMPGRTDNVLLKQYRRLIKEQEEEAVNKDGAK